MVKLWIQLTVKVRRKTVKKHFRYNSRTLVNGMAAKTIQLIILYSLNVLNSRFFTLFDNPPKRKALQNVLIFDANRTRPQTSVKMYRTARRHATFPGGCYCDSIYVHRKFTKYTCALQ